MQIMEVICNAVFNILNIYVDFRIVNLFFVKKELSSFVSRTVYVSVWFVNWIIYYRYNNICLTTVSILVLLFLAVSILYEGYLVQKIVVVCLIVVLGMVVEDIVWRMFSHYGLLKYGESMGTLLSAVAVMIIVLIMERFFRFNKEQYISKESYYNIVIVLLGNIVLVYILAEVAGEERLETLLALSIIGLIDISTFYLYDKVNEGYRQKLERRILEERISMYDNQFSIMQQNQNNLSSLRHDLEKHTLLLKSYMEDGQYEKAKDYIKKIGDFIDVPEEHVNTGNQEVDIILNYALGRAKQMDCKIETRIFLPDSPFMPEFDLNMLLGNLLDNALEALERTEHRYLYVEMHYDRGILIIHIENSFDGKVKKRGDTYLTRKDKKDFHGIGMKNIEEIVKKYDGEEEITVSGKRFKTNILLYVSEL